MVAVQMRRQEEAVSAAGRLVGRSPALQQRRERASAGRARVDDLALALTAAPVQLARLDGALTHVHREVAWRNAELYGDQVPSHFAVQRREAGAARDEEAAVPAEAARGVAGAGSALPYVDVIQRAFGRHDVGAVQAYVGGAAREASEAIGAEAYATGDRVAFRGAPSLHTAAHEATHVVQQRAGVSLKGGVGAAGDAYERHADAVADLVVQGRSAEGLLDTMAGPGGSAAAQRVVQPIQRKVWKGAAQASGSFALGPYFSLAYKQVNAGGATKAQVEIKGKVAKTQRFPIATGFWLEVTFEAAAAMNVLVAEGMTGNFKPALKIEVGVGGGIPGVAGVLAGGNVVGEMDIAIGWSKQRGLTCTGKSLVVKGKPFIKAFAEVAGVKKQVAAMRAKSPGAKWLADKKAVIANLKGDWEWSPTGEKVLAKYDFDTGQWSFPVADELASYRKQVLIEVDATRSISEMTRSTNPLDHRPTAAQQWETLKKGVARDAAAIKNLIGL